MLRLKLNHVSKSGHWFCFMYREDGFSVGYTMSNKCCTVINIWWDMILVSIHDLIATYSYQDNISWILCFQTINLYILNYCGRIIVLIQSHGVVTAQWALWLYNIYHLVQYGCINNFLLWICSKTFGQILPQISPSLKKTAQIELPVLTDSGHKWFFLSFPQEAAVLHEWEGGNETVINKAD